MLSSTVRYMENWIPVVKEELHRSGKVAAALSSTKMQTAASNGSSNSVLGVKRLVEEVMDLSQENRLLQK